MTRVDVVIPCFNAGKFLRRTIDSVLSQTHPFCHIIAIDDGSTDNTLEILRSYGTKLTILQHPNSQNRGQAASLNLGVKHACSHLLSFLDADDIWEKDKIKEQVNIFEQDPNIGLSYVNGYVIDKHDKRLYYIIPQEFFETNIVGNILLNCYIRTPSMVMVRRGLLDKVGLFNENCQSTDHDMWIRMSEITKFYFLNKNLVGYRKHSGQQSLRRRQWEDGFLILDNALRRFNYGFDIKRKRKAVLYYRLGVHDLNSRKILSSVSNFFLAFIHDPLRALAHIFYINSNRIVM